MNTTLLRQSVSELLGTFAIVLAIGGTTMIAFANGGRVMDIALGSGFAVMLLTSIFMAQGAHFNPAITIAMLFTRRIGALPAGVRIAAQVIGATLPAACSSRSCRLNSAPTTARGNDSVRRTCPPAWSGSLTCPGTGVCTLPPSVTGANWSITKRIGAENDGCVKVNASYSGSGGFVVQYSRLSIVTPPASLA